MPRSRYGLLTRHFLRQFLENDLISPDADRSQLLAVVGAIVVCMTLFLSVMMSAAYAMSSMTPGQLSTQSLTDKFFYLALAMLVTALVAVSQWDALVIDPRDAAILEPLPVPVATIWRAKLSAVAILGAAVALAVNGFPTIVFPWLLVISIPKLSMLSLLWLMLTHAIVTTAAATFGYLTVIAFRETLAAVLGPRWFARVSPWAQGVLIVLLGGSLLLLPAAAERTAYRGFQGWRAMTPVVWFLGAYETAAGGVIADLERAEMSPRRANTDRLASATYAGLRGRFPALARRAAMAVALVFLVACAAYIWNARRLPSVAASPPPARRRRWRLAARLANLFVRQPASRAAFYFTLAAMWRSRTHRLTLSCAAAAGCAMAVLALSNGAVTEGGGASARVLAMQPLLYGALLVGFRHIIRVPAELRANWGFQLAWRSQERAFLSGVKSAAIVALVLPALVALLPLYVFVLGAPLALLHAALGLAGAIVLLEALTVYFDKVPFACTYVPSENMKAMAPIYAIAFLIGASTFAQLERDALQGDGLVRLLLTLAILFVILRVIAAKRERLPYVEFDEAPAASFQRLGLDT